LGVSAPLWLGAAATAAPDPGVWHWDINLGDALVAAGTLALAVVTGVLAYQARREVATATSSLAAASRPHVFPFSRMEWVERVGEYKTAWNFLLPFQSAGPGVALNIQGELSFLRPDSSRSAIALIPTSLGPAQVENMELDGSGGPAAAYTDWDDVRGWIVYEDNQGGRWRTDFEYRPSPYTAHRLHAHVLASGPID
jgi:hypothetical protein